MLINDSSEFNKYLSDEFPFIGKYVLCRCYHAGIHTGLLVHYDVEKDMAILKDARRLWEWKSKFCLSEIAIFGITGEKIAVTIPEQMIRHIDEMIPCTAEAEKIIREYPSFESK